MVVPVFKNIEKGVLLNTTALLVFFLWLFGLISYFLSNRWLWIVLNEMTSQEYPTDAVVSQGSILGPTPFLLYINDLPNDATCNIAIYANTIQYSKCDQASNIWQQLELVSELKSDL